MENYLVTIIVYAIALGLLLWGGKFAGFKQGFNEDFMSLEVTKSLRGFAAIGVILHHISQESAFQDIKQLGLFKDAGYFMVAIFFFCSGYGLMKNLDTKPDYLNGFLKKRLPVILVPFYVSAVIYFLYRFLILKETMPVAQIVTGLLGLTAMNEYAWYPVVLALLYLVFYLCFKFIKKKKVAMSLMLCFILFMGLVFCVTGHFAWWAKPGDWWFNSAVTREWWMNEKVLLFSGEWWVNSCIAFFLGMVSANNEKAITGWFQKKYWLKLAVVVVLAQVTLRISRLAQATIGYWSEWNGNGPHISDKLICYLLQLPEVSFFVILVFMILMKYHAQNPVSRFFGKISLDTYMMNLMALWICRPVIYTAFGSAKKTALHYDQGLFVVAVFAVTVLLGLIYKFICDRIQSLFK